MGTYRLGQGHHGRDESYEEKLDRNWGDLLQELRVMQTGAQIITAFLMTLPFQAQFEQTNVFEKTFYVVLLAFSALLSALILTPVAIHRKLFGKHVKAATVAQGHRIVKIALIGVGVMVSGCVAFIVDVLMGWQMMLVIGGAVLVCTLFLLVILPRLLKPIPGPYGTSDGAVPDSDESGDTGRIDGAPRH